MKNIIKLLGCVGALCSLQGIASAQLLNGSFEITTDSGAPADWTLTGNAFDENYNGNPNQYEEGASDGTHSIHFNAGQSTPNAVLSQTFATIPDGVYELTFDFGKYGTDGNNGTAQLLVSVGDGTFNDSQTSFETVSDSTDHAYDAPGSEYSSYDFYFIAGSGSTTTLSFTDTTTDGGINFDTALDNVQVNGTFPTSEAPEPKTWAMLAFGISAYVFLRRNRNLAAR